ncbi:sporulation protein YlmC with PRC-barrel domain [Lewinella aquimaris]|uniref:Sporulation protein YlmC with PRC-barrel domain n=1 Tax=Neolewinella aquimaris TaxID=1835722 RepID=A0A840E7K7_9BACT|nr:PRC-barrel domain-containing protein [Neolewinella aquimaris]MBB4081010.1 sporulation protein YlmC with PRC-barrel domain [Neolewinella aquimaris]
MRNLILSSTSITGTNVTNQKGENLGEIKDLMIDTENGTVNYAVLSFGGFLGMGDKYFAIPFEAFTVNTTKETFVLNVSKDRLENAPGFDKDNWPKTSESKYWDSLHDHYGVQRRTHLSQRTTA